MPLTYPGPGTFNLSAGRLSSILDDGRIATDDVATRSERERPEAAEAPPSDTDLGHDLLDPSDDPGLSDDRFAGLALHVA
jgi:hypothetical protein